MDRDKILQAIRKNNKRPSPLPEPFVASEQKPVVNYVNDFKQSLNQVGANFTDLNGPEEVTHFTDKNYPNAKDFRRMAEWEEFLPTCPKEKLNQIGIIILEGQLGVAENGAIWLDDSNFPNRLLPFITGELVIILKKKNIVRDMTDAYEKLNLAGKGFGLFISGPSKTADIEQNLVYGAHGAVKTKVLLY